MKNNNVFITNNFEETQKLGEDFIKSVKRLNLNQALVVALHGELGGGKTTFVQGAAKGLGIKRRIISPTFVIVRSYELQNQKSPFRSAMQNYAGQAKIFYHIDLYRVNSKKEIQELGMEEIINNKNNIVIIEWAERMEGLLPKNRIDIKFEYLGENKRRITISNFKF